ncbi:hypothetical protein [uncultured Gilvimarinus sp.]|uniref:hypothetical protein n=1 Tax=uncultured Gilvimarinus sp. TaxID=1689143 RepID=UPI0030DA5855
MNPVLLTATLLLPWVAGALVLRPLRQRLRLTQAGWLGYGYFLGAALLVPCAILASILPGLATPVTLILSLLTLTLATSLLAQWARQFLPTAVPPALPPVTRYERWLTLLLLALIAVHLSFSALELYWRPVFPWDAWQTWLYTAKVWYFNGAPIDILPPGQWPKLADEISYTAQGHHYPWLVPVQSWWLASLLGSWDETQVVWPALPAAIALGLALWGQAVAATRQRLAGPIAAWLLLSLPLLQTHVSLAGYADLWLAGFSGLGLIAITRGLLEAHRGQLLLGLAALTLGLLVKHDAIIWLSCGLLLIGLLRLRQMTTTTIVLTGALLLGLLAVGLSRLGLQLHFEFAYYAQLLWLADSWHLLWYLLPGAILLALLPGSPARATAKTVGLLLAILLASQLLLFGATNASGWVGTAASRLLLHVSPLLIFALACIAGASVKALPIRHRWRCAMAILASSLCLLLLVGTWLLLSANSNNKPADALDFKAPQLLVVDGPLRPLYSRLILSPSTDGHAIVSSGPVQFDAETFDLLNVDIDGTNQDKQTFLWRTTARPAKPFTRDLVIGSGKIRLSEDDNWQGEIIEVGLVLYPDTQRTLSLAGLHLEAATPLSLLKLAINDWITPHFWTQISINRTELSASSGLPTLPLLAGLWVLFSWIALRLLTGTAPPVQPLLGAALFAWLLLDARWLHNNYRQALATQAHYAHAADPEALELGDDAALLELARQTRAALGQKPQRVLLVAEDPPQEFALRRLKYALLPHSAYIRKSRVSRRRAASMDAVLWLTTDAWDMQTACPRPLHHTKPVLATSRGILCTLPPQPTALERTPKKPTP